MTMKSEQGASMDGIPAPERVRAAWLATRFEEVPAEPGPIEELCSVLRSLLVNGGVLRACFRIVAHPDIEWFVHRGRLDEVAFVQHFLTSSDFARALPQLAAPRVLPAAARFEWRSAFTLDGELAQELVFGGAYRRFEGTGREAKELGRRVSEALFGERFDEVQIFHSATAWSGWFRGVAWDSTRVVVDRGLMTVWFLCWTDTD